MPKTIEENFIDWESHAFGFGYGSGEQHVISALRSFLDAVGKRRDADTPHGYDYHELETACGQTVAWLLINRLCQLKVINYGVSPRYGWLEPEGMKLKEFIANKTDDELIELITSADKNECYPDACNCGPEGYKKGRKCHNVFWP